MKSEQSLQTEAQAGLMDYRSGGRSQSTTPSVQLVFPIRNVLALAAIVIKELYRRKDFYVLFVLTAVVTLLAGTINIFNDPKIVRYLKEVCLLLIWISALVIAVMTTARQIPAERENRTIFPLLAKPVTRGQLIVGKFAGCWLATGLALVMFYLFFGIISGTREQQWPVGAYFQAMVMQWAMLAVVIALVLLGSVVFTAPSSNATICFIVVFGILLLGRHLRLVGLREPEPISTVVTAVYFLIPHLEWYDLRDFINFNLPPAPWLACAVAVLYAGVYSALLLMATWLVFRRKSLTL
jgi:ABC-type transport system involved in multi-copper enzyme maturation permease subunit